MPVPVGACGDWPNWLSTLNAPPDPPPPDSTWTSRKTITPTAPTPPGSATPGRIDMPPREPVLPRASIMSEPRPPLRFQRTACSYPRRPCGSPTRSGRLALVALDPLGEERLGDAVLAAADPPHQLAPLQRVQRRLHGGGARQRVTALVVAAERAPRPLLRQRLQHALLGRRGAVPDQAEVRVLRAQRRVQRRGDRLEHGGLALGRLLPE